MVNQQQAFLIEEIWLLTFGGAFQHSGIYKAKTKEKERTYFRTKLRGFIERVILLTYENEVDDIQHLEYIKSICEYTANFEEVLKAPINIGISQKLLNLALKYYWCLGILPEPPHCPIDRIIQLKMYKQPLVNWTQLTCTDTYMQIVNDVRVLAKKENQSVAHWELVNFDRRVL